MDKLRILLADDHAVVRAGIRNALETIPNLEIVAEVGDGPSVLAALNTYKPNFLLIDVAMPNFEPLSTIHQIRVDYPEMKVLVVSAYDDDVYVQGLLGAGVDGYHLKDQSLVDLRLAVERVLNGEKWISTRLLEKLVSYKETQTESVPALSSRHQEILRRLQEGLDNQSIARQMGLSVKTIENHLTRLYRQLNVQSRLEAANYVTQHPDVLNAPGKITQSVALPIDNPSGEMIALLLVDDNARYRGQLRRMVDKVYPHAIIYEAENIKEALKKIKQASPRLVLVDVVLGDEDGIQCTRRIKAMAPKSRVILMSAYPDREFHRLGLEAGAVAFLDKKDLDSATLRQVIDDVTG